MTQALIAPHGGKLITNLAGADEQAELRQLARNIPQIEIGSRQLADLEMLANGAYSPLTGFFTRNDYLSVVQDMHLSNGLPWSIPITLSTTTEQAAQLKEGEPVALVNGAGELQAVLQVQEKYTYDKRLEARSVYRTEEEAHPGVRVLYQQGDVLLGGPVRVVALQQQVFAHYRYTPEQSRQLFTERGWKRVVGFQT
ncbi:MAG: sulfate adenylyltransferase, partial [Ktedonobacteraceae bacterium]|nr:sulfate adenylyltransferase [Ktedonobacteraceae bacterium]